MKLSLMKQFIIIANQRWLFQVCHFSFSLPFSQKEMKDRMFDGSQIRLLIKDKHFIRTMSKDEKNARLSFKDLFKKWLGNTRAMNYYGIVQKLLESYKIHG